MKFKLIFGIMLAGAAVLFLIQNTTMVELTFLFWTGSMSQAFLMCLVLSTGTILGWLLRRSFGKEKTISLQSKTP